MLVNLLRHRSGIDNPESLVFAATTRFRPNEDGEEEQSLRDLYRIGQDEEDEDEDEDLEYATKGTLGKNATLRSEGENEWSSPDLQLYLNEVHLIPLLSAAEELAMGFRQEAKSHLVRLEDEFQRSNARHPDPWEMTGWLLEQVARLAPTANALSLIVNGRPSLREDLLDDAIFRKTIDAGVPADVTSLVTRTLHISEQETTQQIPIFPSHSWVLPRDALG